MKKEKGGGETREKRCIDEKRVKKEIKRKIGFMKKREKGKRKREDGLKKDKGKKE